MRFESQWLAVLDHNDLSVDWQPYSLRNLLHSGNCSPFGLVLVIFHPLGLCAANDHSTHTLHPTLQHAFALHHQEGQVLDLYCYCNFDHSKAFSICNKYLSQSFWPSIFHPDFWAQNDNKPAVTHECQSSVLWCQVSACHDHM